MNEFQEADSEVQLMSRPDSSSLPAPSNVIEFREQLIQNHHSASGFIEKLRQSNRMDAEAVIVGLIDELIGETDNLLGNELVATHNGDLRDASIISSKRSEVLEKAIKAVQAKRAFEKESGIDIESPDMIIIFRYFLSKVKETFKQIGLEEEQCDVFFQNFAALTDKWKLELKDMFEEAKAADDRR